VGACRHSLLQNNLCFQFLAFKMQSIVWAIICICVLGVNDAAYVFADRQAIAASVNSTQLIGRRRVSQLTITQADQGKSFEIRRGDRIAIRLAESPTTGYRWAIDQINPEAIALIDSTFSLGSEAGVGGGGVRTFTFQAKTAGTAQIRLKKWRDWEGDSSIDERFDVTVRVRD
jgi:inhibitor of cysteine peptidase